MPKQRQPAPITDTLKRWREEGEAIRRGLIARRQQLIAELSIVEESLGNFGEKIEAPKQRNLRTEKAAPKPAKAAASADKVGRVPQQLRELRPWWGALSGKGREIVEQRAAGKMPDEIAAALKMTSGAVSSALWTMTKKLTAARQAGGGPKAEGDADDEDPGGVEESTEAEVMQLAPAAEDPPPAPTIFDEAAAEPEDAPVARVDQIRRAAQRLKVMPPRKAAARVLYEKGERIICRRGGGFERTGTIDGPGDRPDMFRVSFGGGRWQMFHRDEILRPAPARAG